eukprot:1157780-Pelagomonas_calceolata.AAC.10
MRSKRLDLRAHTHTYTHTTHRHRRLCEPHEGIDHALKQARAVQVAIVVHKQVHQHLAVAAGLTENTHSSDLGASHACACIFRRTARCTSRFAQAGEDLLPVVLF